MSWCRSACIEVLFTSPSRQRGRGGAGEARDGEGVFAAETTPWHSCPLQTHTANLKPQHLPTTDHQVRQEWFRKPYSVAVERPRSKTGSQKNLRPACIRPAPDHAHYRHVGCHRSRRPVDACDRGNQQNKARLETAVQIYGRQDVWPSARSTSWLQRHYRLGAMFAPAQLFQVFVGNERHIRAWVEVRPFNIRCEDTAPLG